MARSPGWLYMNNIINKDIIRVDNFFPTAVSPACVVRHATFAVGCSAQFVSGKKKQNPGVHLLSRDGRLRVAVSTWCCDRYRTTFISLVYTRARRKYVENIKTNRIFNSGNKKKKTTHNEKYTLHWFVSTVCVVGMVDEDVCPLIGRKKGFILDSE